MRLFDVLPHAETGIRRRSWTCGLRIQWMPSNSAWHLIDIFEVSRDLVLTHPPRDLCEMGQGCLTPESMAADDWEPCGRG